MHLKQRIDNIRGNEYFLIAVFFLSVTLLSAIIIYYIRTNERRELLNDIKSSFRIISEMTAESALYGYFRWDDMHDYVDNNNFQEMNKFLEEIPASNRFISRGYIKQALPPETPYKFELDRGILRVAFQITNSDGKNIIRNNTGYIDLHSVEILAAVQHKNLFTFNTSGEPFLYGLLVDYKASWIKPFDFLIIIAFPFLISIVPFIYIRRNNRFFYETKGLDTIIFLFENTEKYSAHHSRNVANLSMILGGRMGLNKSRLKDLHTAALLHDIGKIAIPRDTLVKPGKLSNAERAEIMTHPEASATIVNYFDELSHLAPIVRSHHEKMDGSGYPEGLTGDQIPLESRIIAVADIYEALTGARPYRMPFDPLIALVELRDMAVDQTIVDHLEKYIYSSEKIKIKSMTL
jgi:putative nucleotidyltransferase with HDIG domain